MGVYDILIDGKEMVQVKCLGFLPTEEYPSIRTYYVGDNVLSPEPTMTIITPDYPKGRIYAIIKNSRFIGITRNEDLIFPPLYDKWGNYLESPSDFRNIFANLVEEIANDI